MKAAPQLAVGTDEEAGPAGRPQRRAVAGNALEQRIYDAVFDSVMGQRLQPGTKLPESSLCTLFGATRSVVRKVLQRLAHDHIVELRPNKGAVVASPTPQETRQIFEARRALEGAIARLAAQHATPSEVEDLRTRMAREHDAMHGLDQPGWARLASSFHVRLAELARNPILERYLAELLSRSSLIVALYEPPGNACCEHDEHEGLVRCIAAGDGEGAARAMEAHLLALERRIVPRSSDPAPSLRHMLGLA